MRRPLIFSIMWRGAAAKRVPKIVSRRVQDLIMHEDGRSSDLFPMGSRLVSAELPRKAF